MSTLHFYQIFPKDETSRSNRWVVDDSGLEYVSNHYRNYKKSNSDATAIDRWHEFQVEELKNLIMDFGGMVMEKEPILDFSIDDMKFSVRLRGINDFLDAFDDIRCIRKSGLWGCDVWVNKWYMHPDTIKILNKELKTLYNENKNKILETEKIFYKKLEGMK